MIKFIFLDLNPNVIDAIKSEFSWIVSDTIEFKYICGDLFGYKKEYNQTVYVSPGNSYGIMSGGLDLKFREKFGVGIQDAIQHEIFFNGDLKKIKIGSSVVVKVNYLKEYLCEFLLYVPTMEIPQDISNTNNVELAFYEILNQSCRSFMNGGNHTVICPGLGHQTGKMPVKKNG